LYPNASLKGKIEMGSPLITIVLERGVGSYSAEFEMSTPIMSLIAMGELLVAMTGALLAPSQNRAPLVPEDEPNAIFTPNTMSTKESAHAFPQSKRLNFLIFAALKLTLLLQCAYVLGMRLEVFQV
jgi:hypothetical protein